MHLCETFFADVAVVCDNDDELANSADSLQQLKDVPWLEDVCTLSDFVACDENVPTHNNVGDSPDTILEDLLKVTVDEPACEDSDDDSVDEEEPLIIWPEALRCARQLRNFTLKESPALSKDAIMLEANLEKAQMVARMKSLTQTSLDSWIIRK